MKCDDQASRPFTSDLTAAEWEVMKVVWVRQPCAAGDVQEVLAPGRGWAYSTVKTTMDRMVRKGILRLTRVRNVQLFEAKLSRADAARRELRRVLDRAFDGAVAPMVSHLVVNEHLSPDDLAALRRLIDSATRNDNATR